MEINFAQLLTQSYKKSITSATPWCYAPSLYIAVAMHGIILYLRLRKTDFKQTHPYGTAGWHSPLLSSDNCVQFLHRRVVIWCHCRCDDT